MKSGKYYVGDPCYIFGKSWHEVLEKTSYFEDGEGTLYGLAYSGGSTAYGDGCYRDNEGRSYAVDAGLLACMPVALLKHDGKYTIKSIAKEKEMHVIEFPADFECSVKDGVFKFGHITINTRNEDEE